MNKKILVIEDDIFLGDVLIQKLVKNGFDAVLEKDGAQGFEKIKSYKPDLILLDIVLPNMNGYEILEKKFKDVEIKNIPVIVISNSGQPVEISRVLSLGVKDYLVKAQFDPEEVLVKVRIQLNSGDVVGEKEKHLTSFAPINLEGKKILWVEDDKFLNDIITRKLASTKSIFFRTTDGEEALKIAEEKMPDIIVLDIILSGMDGFEILKRIKTNEKTKKIPVILLSNLGQPMDIEKGKNLGAEMFLTKATITLDEIIMKIEKIVNK